MLDASEVYTAEKILEKYGIIPLRLPPYVLFREINYCHLLFFNFFSFFSYHPEFNPIERIWARGK